jgi:uncharacterized protein YqcC (DUF446 family)
VHEFLLETRSSGLSACVAPELKDDPWRRRWAHGNSPGDGTLRCLSVGDLQFHLRPVYAWKMPRMPLEEDYRADRWLMWLLCPGMDEILLDGQDDLPAGPLSMMLLTHISSDAYKTKESLTNLIIRHEGWARR